MNDFTSQIRGGGKVVGMWSETEVIGNYAIVKVNATQAVLDTINAAPNFLMIPATRLEDTLTSLTSAKKTQLQNKIVSLGYTLQEMRTALGNDLAAITLRQLLVFIASRRQLVRYDANTDQIISDGPILACKPVTQLDKEVV